MSARRRSIVVYVTEWMQVQVDLPKYTPVLARRNTTLTLFQTSESKLFSISFANLIWCYVRKAAAFIAEGSLIKAGYYVNLKIGSGRHLLATLCSLSN